MLSRTGRLALLITALGIVCSGCTINGSRALGEACLQDRECVSGLSCQPRADGRFVCQPVNDGSIFTSPDVVPDAGADAATPDAENDAATE